MKKLEGKIAVVTGASKGIGASIAISLHDRNRFRQSTDCTRNSPRFGELGRVLIRAGSLLHFSLLS